MLSEYPKIIQWYDTIGATGGSFWILLINVLHFIPLEFGKLAELEKILIKKCSNYFALIFIPIFISIYKYNSFQENRGET